MSPAAASRIPERLGPIEIATFFAIAAFIAYAPLTTIGAVLIAALAIAIMIRPVIGLALVAFGIPFGSSIGLPIGLGALTPTPLVLAWTALALGGRALAGLDRRRRLPRLSIALWTGLGAYSIALSISAWRAPSLEASILEMARWAEFGLAALITIIIVTRAPGLGASRWVIAALLAAGASQAVVALWMASAGVGPKAFAVLGGRLLRAHGTFGQPNPFGGYMNLVWPIGAALVIERFLPWHAGRAPRSESGAGPSIDSSRSPTRAIAITGPRKAARPAASTGDVPWSLALLGLAAAGLCLVGLALSWSRGAWLAGAAAGATMAGLWILGLLRRPTAAPFPRGKRWGTTRSAALRTRIPALATLWLLLASGLAAALLDAPIRIPSGVADRLGSIAQGAAADDIAGAEVNDANFATIERLAHWEAARSMWSERPWFGQGPGHFEIVYAEHRLPRWSEPLGHAHNYYLHALAETGLIGLAGYLSLVSVIGAIALRSALFAGSSLERALGLGLAGALASASVHGLFDNVWVHEMPTHLGMLVGLTLALNLGAAGVVSEERRSNRPGGLRGGRERWSRLDREWGARG